MFSPLGNGNPEKKPSGGIAAGVAGDTGTAGHGLSDRAAADPESGAWLYYFSANLCQDTQTIFIPTTIKRQLLSHDVLVTIRNTKTRHTVMPEANL